MSTLYTTDILRLATQIPYTDRLVDADVTVMRTSRVCGSRIIMDAVFEGECLARIGLEVKACALGQASAAVVAPLLIGMKEADILAGAKDFSAMLNQGGPVPSPPFDGLAILHAVRDHKARHGSVMLIFDVALAAFQEKARNKPTL